MKSDPVSRWTRRRFLTTAGIATAATPLSVLLSGCGSGGGGGNNDNSGGGDTGSGFATTLTTRGLHLARYADSGNIRFNRSQWGIDNNGYTLLAGEPLAAPAASRSLAGRLLLIAPTGAQTALPTDAEGFALSRFGAGAFFTDNTGGIASPGQPSDGAPALFRAFAGSGGGGGDGMRSKVIGMDAFPGYTQFGTCAVSDSGAYFVVVVTGKTSSGGAAALYRGNAASGSGSGSPNDLTLLAEAVGETPLGSTTIANGETLHRFEAVAVNDSGDVVFTATRVDGKATIFRAPAGASAPIDLTDPGSGSDDSSAVSVQAIRGEPSLNNAGTVALAIRRTDNRDSLLKWNRAGVMRTVAETEPGRYFGPLSLNTVGDIACTVQDDPLSPVTASVVLLPSVAASLDDGVTVIASGDRVFGRRVLAPRISGPGGLNDRLQMAVSYERAKSGSDTLPDTYEARAVLSVSSQTL